MFWSGNYIGVRELNVLLKEGNVTLTQVLEAYDILQECKADNNALIQFLTKPEILAELITLVTEEPPKNVELTSQYRHANIASEVLASNLFTLRDRLSMDVVQMARLCDFVNKDPPLNPLLASYFSKTIEMLLQRSPKQDWYMHNIVCLRVLDFFKSRHDFLPNLLRHMSTSAICDTFKCFLSLQDPFSKIVIEWLDEYQFLDSLIQIICGAYEDAPPPAPPLDSNRNAAEDGAAARRRAVRAAGAAALLADAALDADAAPAALALCARLRAHACRLLQAAFTAPPASRRAALVHCCRLLLALLAPRPAAELEPLERAIAPHLPLLHTALLRAPPAGVGAERVAAAALLARLAQAEADDVPTALITLGTAGVLIDMLFAYPQNNFLHAEVCAFIRNARENSRFADRYTTHLIEECDLLTRLMDAFEENEDKNGVRAPYMGHVLAALRALHARPPALDGALQQRWSAFCALRLRPLLQRHDTPLGGVYPASNVYEVSADPPQGTTVEEYQIYLQLLKAQEQSRALGAALATQSGPAAGPAGAMKDGTFLEFETDVKNMWDDDDERDDDEPEDERDARRGAEEGAGRGERGEVQSVRNFFRINHKSSAWWYGDGDGNGEGEGDGDDDGDGDGEGDGDGDGDDVGPSAAQRDGSSPWEGGSSECVSEGWAQFDNFPQSDPFWPSTDLESEPRDERQSGADIHDDKDTLTILLAQKMLTAFRNMAPEDADQDHVHQAGDAHYTDDAHQVNVPSQLKDEHQENDVHQVDHAHQVNDTHQVKVAPQVDNERQVKDEHQVNDVHQVNDAHQDNEAHQVNNAHQVNDAHQDNEAHQVNDSHITNDGHLANDSKQTNDENQANDSHQSKDAHPADKTGATSATPGARVKAEW